ncbi:hypothetical protein Y032_0036g3191 [Ancylostoma ceylanicum]|uniref:Uncharacterized protein n=1 Tax=Ancylostoma ceylanicum TaxID=53326 RepID=A0A016UKT8_9BILA|nr:hypothetical protein Y032_0036g3191 [Ancylostoma ceylanicum]
MNQCRFAVFNDEFCFRSLVLVVRVTLLCLPPITTRTQHDGNGRQNRSNASKVMKSSRTTRFLEGFRHTQHIHTILNPNINNLLDLTMKAGCFFRSESVALPHPDTLLQLITVQVNNLLAV